MTEINVKRLGEIIWGFLNACLTATARTCFEGADALNGFDAWRRVVHHIHQGANVRLGTLRRLVKNPPQIRRIEDIDQGIVHFEAIMKDYKAAGGSPPEGIELKNDLLETLPGEIREGLMWSATEIHENFGQFTAHVRSTANAILFHRGKATSSLHKVDEVHDAQDDDEQAYEEEIMAVNRKFNRFGGPGGGRRGEGRGPGGAGGVRPGAPRAQGGRSSPPGAPGENRRMASGDARSRQMRGPIMSDAWAIDAWAATRGPARSDASTAEANTRRLSALSPGSASRIGPATSAASRSISPRTARSARPLERAAAAAREVGQSEL